MSTTPLKILHVNSRMCVQGVAAWLLNVFRRFDRRRFQMDILVHGRNGLYESELKPLGIKLLYHPFCLSVPRSPNNYVELLRQHGPYDVVHNHSADPVLAYARKAGIPVRIMHSHSSRLFIPHGRLRFARRCLFKRMLHTSATGGLAVCAEAATAMFGRSWDRDRRWRVMHTGIDLTPFRAITERASAREALGLPSDALVLGHVGRFSWEKNHPLLFEIAARLAKEHPNVQLLIVGGTFKELKPRLKELVERSLSGRVHFLGVTDNIALPLSSMDAFVLPSLFEGLPLAGLEAQAAGVPLFIPNHITPELDIISPLVHRIPTNATAIEWAERITASLGRHAICLDTRLELLEASSFNIDASVHRLQEYYLEQHELYANCRRTMVASL